MFTRRDKVAALEDLDIRWHLVGHLQRNKIRRTLSCAPLIHSVDSQATLQAIDRIAAESGTTSNVLLPTFLISFHLYR